MEEGVRVASIGDQQKEPSGRERSLQNLIPHQIKPGQVLNPQGAAAVKHDLAKYIRDKTLQGTNLADFLFGVVNGRESLFVSMKDRLKAVELLLNRGWGQAPQTITFEKDANNRPLLDLTKLSPQEFEQFKNLALKIAPMPPSEGVEPKSAENPSTNASGPTISGQDVSKEGGK